MNPHKLLITAYPSKADRRETLDRMTRYYQEAGHSKQTARTLAKKSFTFWQSKRLTPGPKGPIMTPHQQKRD